MDKTEAFEIVDIQDLSDELLNEIVGGGALHINLC